MTHWSIRARMTVWVAAVLGLVLTVMAGTLWWTLRDSVAETIDAGLAARADAIGRFLDQPGGPASIEEMQDDLREFVALDPGLNVIRITDDRHRELYRSTGFDPISAPPSGLGIAATARAFADVTMNGRPLRLITARVPARGRTFVVDVAMPTSEFREVFEEFGLTVLVLLPVGIIAAAAGGYWVSRRALAPVDRIVGTAREITARDLERRIEVPRTSDELQRLAETLNAMLDRLEGSFREISRFTADASHELRTPISLIRTSAELALRRERTGEEYREALTDVLHEAERTTGLVQDLLTLARADASAGGWFQNPVDVGGLLNDMRAPLTDLCTAKHLEFGPAERPASVVVAGDAAALRRLVLILVDNAVKYTPPPGRVSVSLAAADGCALLEVADTGIGIGPEDLPHVFDRFYRADKARSRESGGAGLGLSIAKWIVDRHGGSIGIASEAGRGSRVTVRLPLAPTPSWPESTRSPVGP